MVYTSQDDSDRKTESRYSLVIAVSKRVRQLKEGATPLVEPRSTNPITTAMDEYAAGKLKIVAPTPEEQAAREEEILAPRERKSEIEEAVDLLRAPVQIDEDIEEEDEELEAEEVEELDGGESTAHVNGEDGTDRPFDDDEEPEIVEE